MIALFPLFRDTAYRAGAAPFDISCIHILRQEAANDISRKMGQRRMGSGDEWKMSLDYFFSVFIARLDATHE
jgi:hypothetical protein